MAKILVVDDAKVMRFHISKLLKEQGHTITGEAKNGLEALEEYKKVKPDFVTMDVEMPPTGGVKGGIHAVEKILEYDEKAIIIMISAQTDNDHVSAAIKRGAKNYIRKPITASKLENMIIHLGFNFT